MLIQLKDAEAAVYALESAVLLAGSLAEGNYAQAILDGISLFGWVKNTIES